MTLDPRTPVCVGASMVSQREETPGGGDDALGLMVRAVQAAAADAGRENLAAEAQLVAIPGGSWGYRNAPLFVATAVGATRARTHSIVPGVLQTGMIDRALRAISSGEVDVAVVCGGEALWRDRQARDAGVQAAVHDDAEAPPPDELITPTGHVISPAEIDRKMYDAASHYALIANARRVAEGLGIEDYRQRLAAFWARFSQVAVANPTAWNRTPVSAAEIAAEDANNRLLAFPYRKWHVSQQNVDQASALIFCSAAYATSVGLSSDRWVFPHAIVDSNHAVAVSERPQVHRAPGFGVAGRRALELAGRDMDDMAHVDLYSCFPVSVSTQALELGLDTTRQLTVTGGMVFGGGPYGNYVLASTATMMRVLRDDPGTSGLVTGVSGMLTKQGVCIWSTDPPTNGYRFDDVTEQTANVVKAVPVVEAPGASATVLTYTVNADREGPSRAIAVVDLGDGTRALVTSNDRSQAAAMTHDDPIGRTATLGDDNTFILN